MRPAELEGLGGCRPPRPPQPCVPSPSLGCSEAILVDTSLLGAALLEASLLLGEPFCPVVPLRGEPLRGGLPLGRPFRGELPKTMEGLFEASFFRANLLGASVLKSNFLEVSLLEAVSGGEFFRCVPRQDKPLARATIAVTRVDFG
jgi:hypothetical protein